MKNEVQHELGLGSRSISVSGTTIMCKITCYEAHYVCNIMTPNVKYSGRTAPLTSKVVFYIFIQQIYEMNILNMVYILRFFLFKMQFVS